LRAGIAWDEKRLQYSVREPFPGRTSGTSLVFGAVDNTMTLQLESQMPENGVIFLTG
ncbi:sugar kinase, partial [Morganella morganii]